MKFLSLFAGIGGFDLGLERAGMECAGQVEYDPFCQRVLKHHWPRVKRVGDIHDVTGSDFGSVGLVCGGFPCQPFSCAGKRKGAEDDRYLWPEMFRIIKTYRPAWVLGENVAGIVSMELDKVLSDLESVEYQVQAFIIPACAVDAPHRRDRVWIVAYRSGNRLEIGRVAFGGPPGQFDGSGEIRDVADAYSSGFKERRRPESVQQENGSVESAGEVVSDTVDNGHDRAEGNATEPSGYESNNRIFERGCTWEPEPGVGRVANGVPGRVDRLRSLGNAVVPQTVEAIGRCIVKAEMSR